MSNHDKAHRDLLPTWYCMGFSVMPDDTLPLAGIKIIEFSHMVMGPVTGVILADLGATVTKVEPIGGDKTRNLTGSGAGSSSGAGNLPPKTTRCCGLVPHVTQA